MIDIVEILTRWYAGRSQNELATSLGVDRKTLRKYTGPARAAGIEPGGPPMGEADWRTLVSGWFPELVDTRLRQSSWPRIDPHRDYIAGQLRAGVTVTTIHQRRVCPDPPLSCGTQAHRRDHRPPHRRLGGPAGPEPADGSR